ncbi:hypothetical protein [Catellatospora sichuanensis]|uniref:hypothetical protein n=1 Tax=Catellatospora sichuanensis TaxID=1969805 RepID=UPI00118357B0|nr:hypothetical protein [Catellatospora sichuanensis]
MTRATTAVVLAAVLALAACAAPPSQQEGSPAAGPGWRALPGSPLSPRAQALGLWTGREVLLIGGIDEPCPPGADCAGDPSPLREAAAVDPDTGRWRGLAEMPVALRWMHGVVVGGTAYVRGRSTGEDEVLLAYDIAADRWERAALPPAAESVLVAAGNMLVAMRGSEETAAGPDYRYRPDTGRWAELPADPLGAGFDRTMVWTGRELVLFDRELVPNPGADKPAVARAALLDPARGTWRRLPDSQQLSTGPWLVDGRRLVNPSLGGADGGQVGNWGRTYHNGGVLDPATGTWSALPDPPPAEWGGSAFNATSAVYASSSGPVLNAATGRWSVLPPLTKDEVTGHTVVAAGNRLLVFGGARWPEQTRAELSAQTWLWAPPSR